MGVWVCLRKSIHISLMQKFVYLKIKTYFFSISHNHFAKYPAPDYLFYTIFYWNTFYVFGEREIEREREHI